MVSLWAPNGTPEAVLLEFKILMAKTVLQEQAEAGRSSRGVPLNIAKDRRLAARRLEAGGLEARG